MDRNSLLQNTDYLRRDQYRDSRNLAARAQLHERFGSNPIGWFKWVMAKMLLEPGNHVLECGCGPGWLWRNNLEEIPAGCRLTLTDLSSGMVTEAQEALSATKHHFEFFDADIAALPFDDQDFAVVVANHMLYHVPDRIKAFSEVRRVLRPNGRFFAATIGENHMLELRDLRRQLFPELAASYNQISKEFSLENGQSQLAPWFTQINMVRYKNPLRVTEVDALLDYVLSSSQARSEVDPGRLQKVSQAVQKHIEERGSFDITTDSGMFVAWDEVEP